MSGEFSSLQRGQRMAGPGAGMGGILCAAAPARRVNWHTQGTGMASLKDLDAAKEVLSAQLLRTGARGRAAAMTAALTIAAARKNAGRNVFGVGVARKIVAGKRTGTPCIRLYVVQKLPASVVPKAAMLPKAVDGVPTDVVEAPPPRFHMPVAQQQVDCSQARRTRQRPIVGGISAAHYAVNITTLGCFCRSLRAGEAGRHYMLSCNHAFANMNAGLPGDRILQPSPGDGGGSSPDGDVVGNLTRFFPLSMDGSTPNLIDAAIAEIAPDIEKKGEICTIGPLQGIKAAREQMLVRKHGRSSGYTEGVVDSVNFDWTIQYSATAWVHLVKQIHITPVGFPKFAIAGDSGSVVVVKNSSHAVGLYIGGADDGSYGLASRIGEVCSALKISIP
jgi:hypothetical protein